MNITEKITQILKITKELKKTAFCFVHEEVSYVLDVAGDNIELYLADEYKVTKRRSEKLANYNKIKSEKILWVDGDGNNLGYGEKGKLKSIELASMK